MAMPIPVFINNFNRLTPVQKLMIDLRKQRSIGKITICDNNSTYPPLWDWYRSNDFPEDVDIVFFPDNRGPRGAFNLVWSMGRDFPYPYYVFCDPDMDIEGVPESLLELLRSGLDAYPNCLKTGPSIRYDDIPFEHPERTRIISIEDGFHQKKMGCGFWWQSQLDTQFCMCRRGDLFSYNAMMAPKPFEIRHLSHYYTPKTLTDEDRYYLASIAKEHKPGLYWSTLAVDQPEKYGLK